MNKTQRHQLAEKIKLELLEALKTARIGSMTQKELANELEVDNGTVSRYESSFIDLTIEKYVEMCLILKLDPASLFSKTFYKEENKIKK